MVTFNHKEEDKMADNNFQKYNRTGYVEELEPETKYTSRKVQVDGITLYDSEADFRKNFLKKHLKNTVDVVRFSYMMGKLAVVPIIGPLIRKSLEWHYRYIHAVCARVPALRRQAGWSITPSGHYPSPSRASSGRSCRYCG